MLCELETDKVTVEVPAPAAGTLGEIVAAEGETVGVDALLATLSEGAGAAPAPRPLRKHRNGAGKPADGGGDESVDVMVPTLGESVTEATVATWFKKAGDAVAQDEMLCELETDKVSVEVPAPASGTLSRDSRRRRHDGRGRRQARRDRRQRRSGAPAPGGQPPPAPAAAGRAGGKDVANAPSAEKLMAEKGSRRRQVQGTGRDGRIMKEDVLRAGSAPALRRARAPQPPPRPRAPRSPPRMPSARNG
jgi:2-oxoglutarate dehydrogenase E2 component (dihydrolipoamide succinyltransferase)